MEQWLWQKQQKLHLKVLSVSYTHLDVYKRQEPIHGTIGASSIKQLFGETPEADVTSSSLLEAAKESWDVYHINLNDHSGGRPSVKEGLEDYLGDHVIHTEDSTGKEIPEIISGIVLKSYYANKVKPAEQVGTKSESETITHLR